MRLLIDTNVYSELFRGSREVEEALDEADEILMSTVVLGELYAGFRGGSRYRRNASDLMGFLDDPAVEVVPVSEETSRVFGEVKHRLKRSGKPIPINDVWIASQCLETGAVLATRDEHFARVLGLRIWDAPEAE